MGAGAAARRARRTAGHEREKGKGKCRPNDHTCATSGFPSKTPVVQEPTPITLQAIPKRRCRKASMAVRMIMSPSRAKYSTVGCKGGAPEGAVVVTCDVAFTYRPM